MSLDVEPEKAAATSQQETGGASKEHEERSKKRRSRNRRRRRGKKEGDGPSEVAEQQSARKSRRRGDKARGAKGSNPASSRQPKQQQPNQAGAPTREYGWPSRGVYSAIDLGTNNCRLLIARPNRNGFRVVDAFSRIVRLGEGVAHNNRLSDEAMDRTIEALKVCAEKIARRNVTCMRHVATEACRVAENSEEFVARVKEETGINLDVITAGEEARLAVMGCQSLIAPGNKNALVFDIGGGSTELIWVRVKPGQASEIRGWMSIPWGVVNLSEKYGQIGEAVEAAKYQDMVRRVKDHLQSFEDAHLISEVVNQRRTQFLGTSGTVTTLASLHLDLPKYVRDKVDGAWMKTQDIKELSQRVAGMSFLERAAQPCIGHERADLVVAGCAILEAILGMWQVPSLRVADRGIREGILRSLMQMDVPPIRADRPRVNRGRRRNG